jgi:predicted CoA-binding protein
VDCFVNSQRVGAVVDQVTAEKDRLGIEAVWLQPTCAAAKLLFGPAKTAGG